MIKQFYEGLVPMKPETEKKDYVCEDEITYQIPMIAFECAGEICENPSSFDWNQDSVIMYRNNRIIKFTEYISNDVIVVDENGEKVCMEGRAAELNCWQITDVIESTPTKTYLIEEYDLDKLEKRKYKVTLEDSSPLNTSDNFCVEKYINLYYEYKKEEYVLTDDTPTKIIQ